MKKKNNRKGIGMIGAGLGLAAFGVYKFLKYGAKAKKADEDEEPIEADYEEVDEESDESDEEKD